MTAPDRRTIQSTTGDIEHIVRSTNRVYILRELAREGELHRDELKEGCDVSRTSLQRNLDTLAEQGWIRSSGSRYRITPCGKFVAEAIFDLMEVFAVARELTQVLEWIPVSEIDLELDHLADAEITVAEPGNPHAPVNRHIDTLGTTDVFRGVLPSISQYGINVLQEQIAAGAKQEIVFSRQVVAELGKQPEFETVIESIAASKNCNAYVYEGEIPYYLGIMDETVQIGGEDEKGMPRALLETDRTEVREWAKTVYSTYKEEAKSFTSNAKPPRVRGQSTR